jgi:hypothetical protein
MGASSDVPYVKNVVPELKNVVSAPASRHLKFEVVLPNLRLAVGL